MVSRQGPGQSSRAAPACRTVTVTS
jgi:hypothetical protein